MKVAQIQRFCMHDGPGIRTTVFFKGCPLRCAWCHNPETQSDKPELLFYPARCIGCGACARQCPVSAIQRTDYIAPGKKLAAFAIDPAKCIKCGACVATCKFKAIKEG